LSINDVIRRESVRSGSLLLEWKKIMDRAIPMLESSGLKGMHPDGVHPNIFGNYLYAASLLHLLGYKVPLSSQVVTEFQRYRVDFQTRFQANRELTPEQLNEVLRMLTALANEDVK
jgi:hypothetical protein